MGLSVDMRVGAWPYAGANVQLGNQLRNEAEHSEEKRI